MSLALGRRWLLYFHTVRNLKPSQIYWRIRRRLSTNPAPDAGPPPALRRGAQPLAAFPPKRPSLTGPDAFRFLNRDGRVRNAADWNDPQADALWLYNLHYFDDLCADDAEARREWHEALIARWIAENPVGQGAGWEAYPLSLRVVNWIKWWLARGALSRTAGGVASARQPRARQRNDAAFGIVMREPTSQRWMWSRSSLRMAT